MSTDDLTLPHDPNTGFLRGNPAAALQVAQALAQIEALNRNIQGLVDQIQRNAQAAVSATPNPAPQPAASPAPPADRPAPNAPQQQSRSNQGQSSENWYDQHLYKGVGQSVEDRLIAHAVTGGLGWKT